jgi:AcrR family transcriptional regulator
MTKRAEATEETRRRIVEATVSLHTTKGFEATSWQDISERAEVAVGTVYYHFPTFDELIPACSALGVQLSAPPTTAIFRGLRSRKARLEKLVPEVFAYFERARGGIHNVFREKDQIPALEKVVAEHRARMRELIQAALGPSSTKDHADLVEALLDFRVWESLTDRGIGKEDSVQVMVHLLGCVKSVT